jgi:hypothetical protein
VARGRSAALITGPKAGDLLKPSWGVVVRGRRYAGAGVLGRLGRRPDCGDPPAEIDLANAGQLLSALEAAATQNAIIVVDMAANRFCDSSGVSVLVRAYKRRRRDLAGDGRHCARPGPGGRYFLPLTDAGPRRLRRKDVVPPRGRPGRRDHRGVRAHGNRATRSASTSGSPCTSSSSPPATRIQNRPSTQGSGSSIRAGRTTRTRSGSSLPFGHAILSAVVVRTVESTLQPRPSLLACHDAARSFPVPFSVPSGGTDDQQTRPETPPLRQSPWSGAEARGFEPRMGVNPNRISSPFGIAEEAASGPRLTQSAQVTGVTLYKAPEPSTAQRKLRCAKAVPSQCGCNRGRRMPPSLRRALVTGSACGRASNTLGHYPPRPHTRFSSRSDSAGNVLCGHSSVLASRAMGALML